MRVAIVGCGQLAQMMAKAGAKLDVDFAFLALPGEETGCVEGLGDVVVVDPTTQSPEEIFNALGKPDVVTVEREQLDVQILRSLQPFCAVHPNPDAVAYTQHRVSERNALQKAGLPVSTFTTAANKDELAEAIASLGLPLFIKHPTDGYDGKAQWRIFSQDDFDNLAIDNWDTALLVEQKVDFLYEASIIGARGRDGEIRFYPATRNVHEDGILLTSYAADESSFMSALEPAKDYIGTLLSDWDYVGVLTMELFVTNNGLVVNELAPRVHNSGHWTIDGVESSQFENHIRAITGMALGDTSVTGSAGMVNLLGTDADAALLDGCERHWYGKDIKPKRKVGHINVLPSTSDAVKATTKRLVQAIYPESDAAKS